MEPFFIGPDGKRVTSADLPPRDLLNLTSPQSEPWHSRPLSLRPSGSYRFGSQWPAYFSAGASWNPGAWREGIELFCCRDLPIRVGGRAEAAGVDAPAAAVPAAGMTLAVVMYDMWILGGAASKINRLTDEFKAER